MATLGGGDGSRQTRRTGTNHGHGFHLGRRFDHQFGLITGQRVHQAGGHLASEGVVQTGLVAADTGRDEISAPLCGLVDELRICQEGPRHRHHVGTPLGQHIFRHLGCIDPVRGDHRDAHLAHQLLGDPGKGPARNAGGNRRNAGLVPADPGIDDGCARFLDLFGQHHHFFMGRPIGHQIDHRQTVDDDEILANRLAAAAYHLDRQAHPVFIGSAPAVLALVDMGHQELVEEIPLGPHDLDSVISGLTRPHRGGDEILDLLLDPFLIQRLRWKRRNRGFDGRGRNAFRPIGIAPRMQDLHGDLAACLMHRVGHNLVVGNILIVEQSGGTGKHAAFFTGGHAASDDQCNTTAGAFGIKLGNPGPILGFFQPGMHRPHQHAVLQRGEPQVERGQHVRIVGHG